MGYILISALTLSAIFFRDRAWLRRVTVGVLLTLALFEIGMGLNHIARFGASEDVALLQSQVRYADAYRAGLLAAQDVADRYLATLALCCVCLAVLAWFPAKPKRDRQEVNPPPS